MDTDPEQIAEPTETDRHVANTDDRPVDAIDGLQNLDQEPITEAEYAAELEGAL